MAARRSHKKYTIYEWVFLTMGEKFENQFQAFAKFGDSKSDGTTISLSQSDKWMKQAKVIDNKTCTTTDTGIAFKKFKTMRLSLPEYNKFIDELANTKKLNADDLRKSLAECGAPGTHSAAGPKMSVKTMKMIARLTDPSNFTGIHKHSVEIDPLRKDAEIGSPSSGQSRRTTPNKPHRTVPSRSESPGKLRPPVSTNRYAVGPKNRRGASSAKQDDSRQKIGKKQRTSSSDQPKSP